MIRLLYPLVAIVTLVAVAYWLLMDGLELLVGYRPKEKPPAGGSEALTSARLYR